MTRSQLDQRFYELACKEALGEITPTEHMKLERIQRIRREPVQFDRGRSIMEYQSDLMIKDLRKWFHENPEED